MNFLIVEYFKKNEDEPFLTRSISVIDGEMSLKMLFLTYNENILEKLTGTTYSTGDFINQLDKKCKISNAGNLIDSEALYNALEYTEKDTDIGTIQLATIQISLK